MAEKLVVAPDTGLYVLDTRNRPIPADREFFDDFMKSSRRTVCREQILIDETRVIISTAFMGMKTNGCLFQTIILGGEFSGSEWWYESYEKAQAGHEMIVSAYEDHYESEAVPCKS